MTFGQQSGASLHAILARQPEIGDGRAVLRIVQARPLQRVLQRDGEGSARRRVELALGACAVSVTCAKLEPPSASRTKMKIQDSGFGQMWERSFLGRKNVDLMCLHGVTSEMNAVDCEAMKVPEPQRDCQAASTSRSPAFRCN